MDEVYTLIYFNTGSVAKISILWMLFFPCVCACVFYNLYFCKANIPEKFVDQWVDVDILAHLAVSINFKLIKLSLCSRTYYVQYRISSAMDPNTEPRSLFLLW